MMESRQNEGVSGDRETRDSILKEGGGRGSE